MEVAFYPSNSLANYEQQSSPSSTRSACSADVGLVSAIRRLYPSNNFSKEAASGLNFDTNCHAQTNTTITSETLNNREQAQNSRDHQNRDQVARHQGLITSFFGNVASAHALASPDINMLKLGSPDLERLINGNQHSCGQSIQQKQQLVSGVTQEQEMYAQGFERELERIKSRTASDPNIPTLGIQSGNGGQESYQCGVITTGAGEHSLMGQQHPYINEQHYSHSTPNSNSDALVNCSAGAMQTIGNRVVPHLKEEPPQTVPVMSLTPPSMSPIDMMGQEAMKSERKRQRNRIAASKCRKRKLERISRLEEKVENLKSQNMELSTNANVLRQQVAELKSKVMAHVNSGCQLMMNQQQVNL